MQAHLLDATAKKFSMRCIAYFELGTLLNQNPARCANAASDDDRDVPSLSSQTWIWRTCQPSLAPALSHSRCCISDFGAVIRPQKTTILFLEKPEAPCPKHEGEGVQCALPCWSFAEQGLSAWVAILQLVLQLETCQLGIQANLVVDHCNVGLRTHLSAKFGSGHRCPTAQ